MSSFCELKNFDCPQSDQRYYAVSIFDNDNILVDRHLVNSQDTIQKIDFSAILTVRNNEQYTIAVSAVNCAAIREVYMPFVHCIDEKPHLQDLVQNVAVQKSYPFSFTVYNINFGVSCSGQQNDVSVFDSASNLNCDTTFQGNDVTVTCVMKDYNNTENQCVNLLVKNNLQDNLQESNHGIMRISLNFCIFGNELDPSVTIISQIGIDHSYYYTSGTVTQSTLKISGKFAVDNVYSLNEPIIPFVSIFDQNHAEVFIEENLSDVTSVYPLLRPDEKYVMKFGHKIGETKRFIQKTFTFRTMDFSKLNPIIVSPPFGSVVDETFSVKSQFDGIPTLTFFNVYCYPAINQLPKLTSNNAAITISNELFNDCHGVIGLEVVIETNENITVVSTPMHQLYSKSWSYFSDIESFTLNTPCDRIINFTFNSFCLE